MEKKKGHLSRDERGIIECLNNNGHSARYIATELNRSHNTISYELKYNKVNGIYDANKAHEKAYQRRYRCKRDCMKVAINLFLLNYVDSHIRLKWSPERISGILRVELGIVCSSKAIYKFVLARNLERFLMHKGKKSNKSYYQYLKYIVGDRKWIDTRPEILGYGHYELDFIVSSHNTTVLLVCVEKLTRYTQILLLPNRKHSTIVSAFYELFEGKSILSITTDNDIAFSKWKQLEKLFNTSIYFTHPYSSWEKGLVENTNRWIREYIPKRSDLTLISDTQIKDALYYLNDMPRQILGYKKASMLYYEHVLIGG